MSTYPGDDAARPESDPEDEQAAEPTAPVSPGGPVFNPTSAQPTTPHEQGYAQPGYGQAPQQPNPPQYGQPQYGQPQHGQPQYGQPQYGQPQYGQPPYGQPPYTAFNPPVPDQPQATLALVLGLVSLVGALILCGLPLLVSPFAWAIGRNSLKEIEASQGRLGGESQARAGMIMGIIGSVIALLVLLALIAFAVLLVVGVTADGGYT